MRHPGNIYRDRRLAPEPLPRLPKRGDIPDWMELGLYRVNAPLISQLPRRDSKGVGHLVARLSDPAEPHYLIERADLRGPLPLDVKAAVEKMIQFFLRSSDFDRDRIASQQGWTTIVRAPCGITWSNFTPNDPMTLAIHRMGF